VRRADEVYDALAPAVLGYFRSHGIGDAEDLTGDVFVKVTEHLSGFRGTDVALRRWVFTIAHHRLIDEFRRAGRSRPTPEFDDSSLSVVEPDPLDDDLIRAISGLTDEQREVVVLRFVADLPLRDVARITGRRTGAVKMAQARGLAALHDALSASTVPVTPGSMDA
jgi:RNA polymerase sigma-70 factor (ECF subfamily)